MIGFFSVKYGVGAALTITAIAFVLGGLSIFLLPETKGAKLG